MILKIRKLSLEQQLFLSFLSLSVLLLLLSLSITLSFTFTSRRDKIDKNIIETAAYISSLEHVTAMLENGYPDPVASKELDALSESFSDINVIIIYDASGLRFYHTERQKTGETFVSGDEKAILSGSSPYITTGYGTRGSQRRAFHSIKNQEGTIIGFVMVSVFTSYISDQIWDLLPVYALILFTMLIISFFLTHEIMRLLHSSLLGHRPEELLDLYIKQDTVLNAMTEGIIATDTEGIIVFANHRAKELFPDVSEPAGHRLSALFSDFAADLVITEGISIYNKNCLLNHRQLLYTELPIVSGTSIQGALVIFNDRTEVEALSDELSGAQSMLNTLRAFNHEFLNKLHVILGYLQTGKIEDAITFITNSSRVSSDALHKTAAALRTPRLCALVIGKMMHAAELGITLSTAPDSHCYEKDLFIPIDVCVTIIGNLLENAIEELAACQKETKEICIGIYCHDTVLLISCEDSGRGIPQSLLPVIWERGVSSKGENRGTGLFLIRQLAEEYHGDITLETETNEGTCMTISFSKAESEELL